ncbi:OTU-like cysteine protease [Medicago truncatula]|uniref:OTU-like cysteine protease n=1 Tax=Medicago truncatula TaxID=3880 RepID=A0A072TXG3_MEDTR|nr:OTU-like cysteine protease [Medicago truncatula]
MGDLGTCWEKIHDMLVLQFTVIQTTFGQSVTMLEHRFKYVTLYSGLGGYVSRYALDNIALEETRCRETLLRMGEESNEVGFSIDVELKAIVEHLKKLPFEMKLEVKEGLRQLAFPETTMMSPPPRKVVDSQNPDSQPSPSPTTSTYKRKKGARLGKISLNPLQPPSRYPKPKAIPVMRTIDYMPRFMLPFIEKVVDVIGDGHCGFRAIAEFMGLTEQNHIMIRTLLIQEVKDHRDDYVEVFAGEDRYNYILNGLHPSANTKSFAHLVDKWLTFPDMGHIVANYYKNVFGRVDKS